jgi:hypothetical protein
MFYRGADEMIGRAAGPLYFRLLVMPIVVTFFGALAGLRDAREGRRLFLWAGIFTNAGERWRLLRSAVKDVGMVFTVAIILDTIYQFLVLKAFYPMQVLVVAVACAIVPYVLSRGLINFVMRGHYRRHPSADALATRTTADREHEK